MIDGNVSMSQGEPPTTPIVAWATMED
jgi:hypothetical protein